MGQPEGSGGQLEESEVSESQPKGSGGQLEGYKRSEGQPTESGGPRADKRGQMAS